MKQVKKIFVAGLVVVLLFLSGCSQTDREELVEIEKLIPVVKTFAISQPSLTPQWRLTGVVSARFQPSLSFRVNGKIIARSINEGDLVAANQILLQLDPTDYELALKIISANIRATTAEINQAKLALQRQKELLTRNLISQQNIDQSSSQLTVLQERLKAQILQEKQAKNQLNYTLLQAPAQGKILAMQSQVGEVVRAGEPVVSMVLSGNREITVQVPESRLTDLPQQAQVVIYGSSHFYLVQLRHLAKKADSLSRTWTANYEFIAVNHQENKPFNSLALGKTATLIFETDDKYIKVPNTALYDQGDFVSVWQVIDGKVYRFPVKVIQLSERWAWIDAVEGDFSAVESIVSLGVDRLNDGQAVRESAE